MESIERRRVERYDLELPAKIRVPDAAADTVDLTTANISSGGAYFHTPKPLPEGTDVQIDLILNLEKLTSLKKNYRHVSVELKGKVIRNDADGMSIQFHQDYQFRPWQPSTHH